MYDHGRDSSKLIEVAVSTQTLTTLIIMHQSSFSPEKKRKHTGDVLVVLFDWPGALECNGENKF